MNSRRKKKLILLLLLLLLKKKRNNNHINCSLHKWPWFVYKYYEPWKWICILCAFWVIKKWRTHALARTNARSYFCLFIVAVQMFTCHIALIFIFSYFQIWIDFICSQREEGREVETSRRTCFEYVRRHIHNAIF